MVGFSGALKIKSAFDKCFLLSPLVYFFTILVGLNVCNCILLTLNQLFKITKVFKLKINTGKSEPGHFINFL